MIPLVLLLACRPGGSAGTQQPAAVVTDPPAITLVDWACDVDDATWAFLVQTQRWSGGGYVWMIQDDQTWERHIAYSVAAANDGSTDELSLELDIVSDWRDAVSGSSSRFLCGQEQALAYVVQVYTQDYSAVADCRWWGDGELLDGNDDLPACDQPLTDADLPEAD